MTDRKLDPGQARVADAVAVLRNAPLRSWAGLDSDDVAFVHEQAGKVLTVREVKARPEKPSAPKSKKPEKPEPCRHPIGRRIGDSCAVCGAKVAPRR